MNDYDPELQRSCFYGSRDAWRRAREVILEAVYKDGTFLDVGCANGVLVGDLCLWAQERKIKLTPFGIDLDEKLIAECRARFPEFKKNFIVADRFEFKPKRKFTFICAFFNFRNRMTEIYLKRYLTMLEPGGRLILTRYDDYKDEFMLLEKYLKKLESKLNFSFAGTAEVQDITKVFWLENKAG